MYCGNWDCGLSLASSFNIVFMYLLLISVSLCITYCFLRWLFPLFFSKLKNHDVRSGFVSILMIFCFSLLGYLVTYSIDDPELRNRFLHGFGGGFMALYTCYLAVKDAGINLTKIQFFIFALLVVGNLGVANEILEFALQSITGITFVSSVYDTWYDLVSNTLGSLIAAVVFTPMVVRSNHDEIGT